MPVFYLRNDDVNILDQELQDVTGRSKDEGVPLTQAVEPANVSQEAVDWLLREKASAPRLVEIMQHGYDHKKRDVGEFGGKRPYDDQLKDLKAGRGILADHFGDAFIPCLNFPFGPYNQHSMRAADDIGYRIISSHYNCRLSRRAMYAVGHMFRRGQILDRHVSYHLGKYPRTGLFCIDMAISFIKSYQGEYGSRECTFHSFDWMRRRIDEFIPHTPVIGLLLHHRFHTSEESLDLVTEVLRYAKSIPGSEFLNLEEIYQRYSPDPGEGFRHEF